MGKPIVSSPAGLHNRVGNLRFSTSPRNLFIPMNFFVFVLMPFGRTFNKRYKSAIKAAVHAAGMRAERVDKQSFHRQGITERIIQQIQDADILVADLSTNNPNVLYEVGYAYAKDKLCILLTKDAKSIPFDLKNKRHIVFSNLNDLKKKLSEDLEALKVEAELSFEINDDQCRAIVSVAIYETRTINNSQATSIRAKVKTGSKIERKNVSAQIVKIERRTGTRRWERFKLGQPIQLIWTDTDTISTNFSGLSTKYVNVFHIDHNENKLTIWRSLPNALLSEFLNENARYRVTVSVMGRQIQLNIDWDGHWNTMRVDLPKQKTLKP